MVDAVLSGYKAAAQGVVFSGTRTLVSLADEEYTDESDEIDNSITKYMMSDWEFVCTSVVFTGTDSSIELFIIPSIDDTNYPAWTGDGIVDQQENNPFYVGSFSLTGTTAAQRASLRSVALPAGKFKVGVRNRGNVALAASGSTLKWRPWQYSSQ